VTTAPPHHAYPEAERLDLAANLHGHRVADPYRWLEDADDPRTRTWSPAQDKLTPDQLAFLAQHTGLELA